MSEAGAPADHAASSEPIERLLDLLIFAPLGLLLEGERVVPELADAGRKQLAFTRSLGRAALSTIAKAAASSPTQAATAEPGPDKKPPSTKKKSPATKTKEPAATKKKSPAQNKKPAATKKKSPATKTKKAPANKTAGGRAGAALAGYEQMTARELIATIDGGLSAAQIRWLRQTEAQGKARVTVLRRLDKAQ